MGSSLSETLQELEEAALVIESYVVNDWDEVVQVVINGEELGNVPVYMP